MSTIAKYNQPILYSYTYSLPLGGSVKEHTIDGMIPADQDSFAMEPGSKLNLALPEQPDAAESWTATCDSKGLQVQDKGFTPSNPDPKADGSAGYHSFMFQLSGGVPEGTAIHLVLNRLGKAEAEKTLNIQTAYAALKH